MVRDPTLFLFDEPLSNLDAKPRNQMRNEIKALQRRLGTTATHLKPIAPYVALLSEVDHGMARTSQRHTTTEMARALGMVYAFRVEFHELDQGGPTERSFCTDEINDHGHWFASEAGAADPEQPRVRGRIAIVAVIPTASGPVCVVSTHLESNADTAHRHAQFDLLLQKIDAFAPGLPVLIGGDLNTGNHLPPDFDWQRETLFDLAVGHGYSWAFTPPGLTTRPSLITPHPDREMMLDWLAGRGFAPVESGILTSISASGPRYQTTIASGAPSGP